MINVDQEAYIAHKNAIAKQSREQAYRVESDPIYFLWQRGEATEQEWLNKITEIKERYPYDGL